MEAERAEVIKTLKGISHSAAKSAILKRLSPAFWDAMVDKYGGIDRIAQAIGLSRTTVLKYVQINKTRYDHSCNKSCDQKVIEAWLRKFDGKVNGLMQAYEDPQLPTDKTWLILADSHIPTVSVKWLRRALAVAQYMGCDAVAHMGDFGNYDAISRFAERDRGTMPRLQEEIDLIREPVKMLDELFEENCYYMLSNHEARMLAALKHELDADDFFESLLHGGKWVESNYVNIGEHRFIHPDRGRKVLSSQANEYSMRYEQPVWLAHSHRFFIGYSNAGRPIGMLGGLFDADRIRYYRKTAGYLQWRNAFFVLKRGMMIPFAEGFTDWADYGVE